MNTPSRSIEAPSSARADVCVCVRNAVRTKHGDAGHTNRRARGNGLLHRLSPPKNDPRAACAAVVACACAPKLRTCPASLLVARSDSALAFCRRLLSEPSRCGRCSLARSCEMGEGEGICAKGKACGRGCFPSRLPGTRHKSKRGRRLGWWMHRMDVRPGRIHSALRPSDEMRGSILDGLGSPLPYS